ALDVGAPRDVPASVHHGDAGRAQRVEIVADRLVARPAAAHEDEMAGAAAGEPLGDLEPEPAGTAGDEIARAGVEPVRRLGARRDGDRLEVEAQYVLADVLALRHDAEGRGGLRHGDARERDGPVVAGLEARGQLA